MYKININFIEVCLINSNFFLNIKNIRKNEFKNITLINEIVDPKIIEIGKNKNNK